MSRRGYELLLPQELPPPPPELPPPHELPPESPPLQDVPVYELLPG